MHSGKSDEHFVTLFDSNFLPMGMCLHASLMEHGQPFHLWILCMDELVEQQLRQLALPHVSLIPLQEVETDALLGVKNGRTRGEYCWTLTPFTPQFVFDRDQTIKRVTYLDADIFFFNSPQVLLKEFKESGKHVLITEHAYAPEYDHSVTSGRFCVQFMTFRRTHEGKAVMQWWQDRCIDWCFSRFEDGKFGDQKYLDDWPERFTDSVHVLKQREKTLAPWNLRRFTKYSSKPTNFVLYHFHSLRIVKSNRVILYSNYKLGEVSDYIYERYLDCLRGCVGLMRDRGMNVPVIPLQNDLLSVFRAIKNRLFGMMRTASI